MADRRDYLFYRSSALVLFLALAAANLFFGELNQDEGWYLYAARQVAEGRRPYADFAFTQGPALPAFYAALDPVVRRGGVGAGRALTALLGLASVGLFAALAGRLATAEAAPGARAAAWVLGAVNVYQSYFTTVVKTYSLCNLFLALGFLALANARGRRAAAWCAVSGAALALAAATRLSAAAAFGATGLWLVLGGRRAAPRGWLAFGAGGAVVAALAFGPALRSAPEGLWFGLVEYHSGRDGGTALSAAVFRAGFLSRMALAYWPAAAAALGLLLFRGARDWRSGPAAHSSSAPLLWSAGAMTLVHFFAPFPYDDYQAIVYPLFAAALAAALARAAVAVLDDATPMLRWIALLCVVSALASPINQQWAILRRDRIWWRAKTTPDLLALRRAAAWLRERMPAQAALMTQDAYLAVEIGCRVPPGFELGPFSYFPEMSRARAERLRVLNRERLLETLERADAPWAAFSGYGLSIACPGVVEIPADEQARLRAALEARYVLERRFPDFGQAHTELRVYRRKE